jgi:hypothetical protein
MKLYLPGDTGQAICEKDGLTSMTFAYRDVPFENGTGYVRDILVGVCDKCGAVIATPPQSTPAIRAKRDKASVPVETNLPAIYIEALDLAAYRIDAQLTPDFRKRLLMYYLHDCATNNASLTKFLAASDQLAPIGKTSKLRKRLSLKVTARNQSEIEKMAQICDLNTTALLQKLIAYIHSEISTVEKPHHLKALRTLALVAA